jgi:phosphoribosyl-ATP pyrophosphohydrolase
MRDTLARLEHTIAQRSNAAPDSSYVASLFAKGREKIAQKVSEEATETIIAALSGNAEHLTAEAADLLFHLMILLNEGGVAFDNVLAELDRRDGVSGLVEKAARDNSGE